MGDGTRRRHGCPGKRWLHVVTEEPILTPPSVTSITLGPARASPGCATRIPLYVSSKRKLPSASSTASSRSKKRCDIQLKKMNFSSSKFVVDLSRYSTGGPRTFVRACYCHHERAWTGQRPMGEETPVFPARFSLRITAVCQCSREAIFGQM